MEQLTVRWHGHACFSLTCRDFTVVLDPYEDHYVPGFPPLRLTGDLVLCSHQHNDHNAAEIVTLRTGRPNPFRITKIPTFHDPEGGRLGGRTPSICWRWASCGWPISGTWAVPSLPRKRQSSRAWTRPWCPWGAFYTIGPQEAKALLDDLRPKVFLPMHYRMGAVGLPAVGQVEDFLSLVENYVYYPTDTLSLDEGTKPQIAVLHCSV